MLTRFIGSCESVSRANTIRWRTCWTFGNATWSTYEISLNSTIIMSTYYPSLMPFQNFFIWYLGGQRPVPLWSMPFSRYWRKLNILNFLAAPSLLWRIRAKDYKTASFRNSCDARATCFRCIWTNSWNAQSRNEHILGFAVGCKYISLIKIHRDISTFVYIC